MARQHFVDFGHRDAGIAFAVDFEQRLLRGLESIKPNHAEEMPGGVLDIVWIDRLMQLKLTPALAVFAAVVVGNSTLPKLRCQLRIKLSRPVEVRERARDIVVAELLNAARDQGCSVFGANIGRSGPD